LRANHFAQNGDEPVTGRDELCACKSMNNMNI
jgi:hypothetical protein